MSQPLKSGGVGSAGLAALLLAALVGAAPASAALTECRVPGLRNAVQCGVLQRPLDPARPDATRIDLHYVVVPALAARPSARVAAARRPRITRRAAA